MNKLLLAPSLLAVGLLAAAAAAQGDRFGQDRREAEKHGWVFNYDAAKQQARKSGRPLMVVLRCVP